MPHHWSPPSSGSTILTLTPHNSLPKRGFAFMILATFAMIILPLFSVLGTGVLWFLLPFLLMTVAALWVALRRSYKDADITEHLSRSGDMLTLTHKNAKGIPQTWECNIYWARADLHPNDGPVKNYVTLKGNGRCVEIGAFLSEEERLILYSELIDYLKTPPAPHAP